MPLVVQVEEALDQSSPVQVLPLLVCLQLLLVEEGRLDKPERPHSSAVPSSRRVEEQAERILAAMVRLVAQEEAAQEALPLPVLEDLAPPEAIMGVTVLLTAHSRTVEAVVALVQSEQTPLLLRKPGQAELVYLVRSPVRRSRMGAEAAGRIGRLVITVRVVLEEAAQVMEIPTQVPLVPRI